MSALILLISRARSMPVMRGMECNRLSRGPYAPGVFRTAGERLRPG
jgi:hypothetical protein